MLTGLEGFGNDLLQSMEGANSPLLGKLRGDMSLHMRDAQIIYSFEIGMEPVLPYGFYATTLGSGLGPGMLSQSVNYGRGFFEGMKFYMHQGKIYIPHPDDNTERMREGNRRLGYQFDYSNEKVTYLSMALLGMNGWIGEWPKVEGIDASVVYIRPLSFFPFSTKIRLGGPHINAVAIIPEPMGSYFDDKSRELGVNVFVFDSPQNPFFAHNEAASLKNNSNYEPASWMRNLAESLSTAETVKFTNGMLKEGSGDTVGIITRDGTLVFPPLSTGRLNGISAQFVAEMSNRMGYSVELREVSMKDFLDSEGIILLGNAVNFMGVGNAIIPVEYLKKYLADADFGRLAPCSKKTLMIGEKQSEVWEFRFDSLKHPLFGKIKQAFERFLPDYSVCVQDVLEADAGEKLKGIGDSLRKEVPENSLRIMRLPVPNLLREGALLSLDRRLWPKPGKKEVNSAWSSGLKNQNRLVLQR